MIGVSSFRICVGDDPEHEDLTAELDYDGVYLAIISQDEGLENAVVEIQNCPYEQANRKPGTHPDI